MDPVYFGKTNSRSVLGTINDFTHILRDMLPIRSNYSVYDWSDNFAGIPCGPINYGLPKELAVKLAMQKS